MNLIFFSLEKTSHFDSDDSEFRSNDRTQVEVVFLIEGMSNRKRILFKVIVLGESGVGKTSLVDVLVRRKFMQPYKCTIGCDFMTKEFVIDEKAITLQLWDTAGQERFQSLGMAFYRGADMCMLCFDLSRPETLEKCIFWKEECVRAEDSMFILVGCKSDLERKVDDKDIKSVCNKLGVQYFETSAKENKNIESTFEEVARRCLYGDENECRLLATKEALYCCLLIFKNRKTILNVLPKDVMMYLLKEHVWKERYSEIWDKSATKRMRIDQEELSLDINGITDDGWFAWCNLL